MKRLYTLMLLLVFIQCSNDQHPDNSNPLIGSWQLVAQLADPGDGSGVFMNVESNMMITFEPDDTYSSTESLCGSLSEETTRTGTYNTTTQIIKPNDCQTGFGEIHYEFEGDYLILTFSCIEACKEKYTRL